MGREAFSAPEKGEAEVACHVPTFDPCLPELGQVAKAMGEEVGVNCLAP